MHISNKRNDLKLLNENRNIANIHIKYIENNTICKLLSNYENQSYRIECM